MAKQYSRREILRAMMLGGGLIAGELWWPGQKLISIPTTEEVLRFTATERYSMGWADERMVFGLAQVKPEGGIVHYDPDPLTLEGNEEAVVWQRVDGSEIFDRVEAKRQAKLLGRL